MKIGRNQGQELGAGGINILFSINSIIRNDSIIV